MKVVLNEKKFNEVYKEYLEELEGSAFFMVNCTYMQWRKHHKKLTKQMVLKILHEQ